MLRSILVSCFVSLFQVFSFSQQDKNKALSVKLDSAFAGIFKTDEPGGSIFIQQDDKVLYQKSFGLADIKTKEPFSSKTVSNLGSISKTFVAYGILMLQKQGKLSVEDNIIKYFPEFKNKEIARKVKIKHLLTHTSGLPDCRNVDKDSVFYLTAKDDENFRPLTLTDTMDFEPGTSWKYSNPAYNGLALIIEKITGKRWQDYIINNIFKPSGMVNSKITDGSYPETGVAHGYIMSEGKWKEYDYGEYPTFDAAGNGGIWSSIDELRKYVDAINTCKFTDCATIKLSESKWSPENWKEKTPCRHSLAWFVYDDKQFNTPAIEHSGDQGGFKAHLILYPEKKITIIWLSNNDKFLTPVIRKVMNDLNF